MAPCLALSQTEDTSPCSWLLTEAHGVVCISPWRAHRGFSEALAKGVLKERLDEVGKSPEKKPGPCGTHPLVPVATQPKGTGISPQGHCREGGVRGRHLPLLRQS